MSLSSLEDDVCRCCHTEGKFRSLWESPRGTDAFFQVLKKVFDIELSPVGEPVQRNLFTICQSCETRLEDADNFKQQVLACEKIFYQLYTEVLSDEKVTVKVKEEDENLQGNVICEEVPTDNKKTRGSRQSCKRKAKQSSKIARRETRQTRQARQRGIEVAVVDDISLPVTCAIIKTENESDPIFEVQVKNESNPTFNNENEDVIEGRELENKTKLILDVPGSNGANPDLESRDIISSHEVESDSDGLTDADAFMEKQKDTVPTKPKKKRKMGQIKSKSESILKKILIRELGRRNVYRLKDSDYTTIDSRFQCARCDSILDTKKKLRTHIKVVHLNMVQHFCEVCNESFGTLPSFTRHKYEQHNIDDREQCNACNIYFNSKQQLRKHVKSYHMLGRKYKCEFCEYECYSAESLYKHNFKHKTVKDFHCRYCKKSFLRKTTLDLHERIHTGDRRKVCKECGQAFVQKASLNYHMAKYHPGVIF